MANVVRTQDDILSAGIVNQNNPLLAALVEEVHFCLYPPIHERKSQSYGCIISDEALSHLEAVNGICGASEKFVRQLANGNTSFCVKNSKQFTGVASLSTAEDDERGLLKVQEIGKGVLVHLGQDKRTRVFTKHAIFVYENGEWIRRPLASSVVGAVLDAVPQATCDVVESLLVFGYHVLSPGNVGSTIVLWLDDKMGQPPAAEDCGSIRLNFLNEEHVPLLRSLVAMRDGAAFVSSDGYLRSIENHLKYSQKSEEIVPQSHGTRHTSAQRFSFDYVNALVLVISEDGPVSIYSDGVKVTELHQYRIGETASALRDMVPAKAEDVFSSCWDAKCESCGKGVEIEVVTVVGWRERETGECPVCGNVVATKNCWQINVNLRKQL